MGGSGVDPARVAALKEREDAAFARARPRSRELWESGQSVMPNGVPMSWLRTSYDHPPLFVESASGSRLRDVDGHEYADFNIADMSMFTGYGPAPVVAAASRQVAWRERSAPSGVRMRRSRKRSARAPSITSAPVGPGS